MFGLSLDGRIDFCCLMPGSEGLLCCLMLSYFLLALMSGVEGLFSLDGWF